MQIEAPSHCPYRAALACEAVATSINWLGLWKEADFEGPLRGDALSWEKEDVRRFVGSGGTAVPEMLLDEEDSPCPYTGAGASWKHDVPCPWWVEAQSRPSFN